MFSDARWGCPITMRSMPEVFNASVPAAVGGWLEARLDGFEPAVGEFLEVQAASVFGLAEARDFLAELDQPAVGQHALRGLERPAKLLAVTFDEGIVNA